MSVKKQAGFTLLELMITVVILAILSALAYPNMRNFMRHNQVVSQSNSLQSNLMYARGLAASTRSYVSICPVSTAGSMTCSTTSGTYDLGWLVYTTTSPNTAYSAAVTTSLQMNVTAPVNVSIRAGSVGVLTYNARGELLVAPAQQPTSVTFTTCAKSSSSDSIGTNTVAVPGIQLNAANSGRVSSTVLSTGAACS
jgi:type IV fimbrial biogenesis protein FimT